MAGLALAAALAAAFSAALWGCSAQDRYESVRDDNLRQCERLVTQAQREECRARLPPESYAEYERLRRTAPRPGA